MSLRKVKTKVNNFMDSTTINKKRKSKVVEQKEKNEKIDNKNRAEQKVKEGKERKDSKEKKESKSKKIGGLRFDRKKYSLQIPHRCDVEKTIVPKIQDHFDPNRRPHKSSLKEKRTLIGEDNDFNSSLLNVVNINNHLKEEEEEEMKTKKTKSIKTRKRKLFLE